eukprot:scaffold300714_cov15-Prasinocladus_malaysianus.AAC.1
MKIKDKAMHLSVELTKATHKSLNFNRQHAIQVSGAFCYFVLVSSTTVCLPECHYQAVTLREGGFRLLNKDKLNLQHCEQHSTCQAYDYHRTAAWAMVNGSQSRNVLLGR